MKIKIFLELAYRGFNAILSRRKNPLVGSIIVTDKCNLACRHCRAHDNKGVIYSHAQIKKDMQTLYEAGVRVLIFYGGEPLLWQDRDFTLRDLIVEAKKMGFLLVNVVTNGTLALDIPEADLILVSLDGDRETHNEIRGDTYDKIMENIEQVTTANICFYMAINQINKHQIKAVCERAKQEKKVKAVSFNFHTPYPGTEQLKLTKEEKKNCCDQIAGLLKDGYPILNLKSAFPYIINNTFATPCYQCVLIENGQQWICGRCLEVPGLCQECGYFFAAEYSLLFSGKLKVIFDFFTTYFKYI